MGLVVSCSRTAESERKTADSLVDKKDYKSAAAYYLKAIHRSEDRAAKAEAQIQLAQLYLNFLEKPLEAIDQLQKAIVNARDSKIRKIAQMQVADIYFERLTDYKKAILEINKVLSLHISDKQRADYQLKLAKSYYYLEQFYQAEAEVKEMDKIEGLSDEAAFQAQLLLASILQGKKDTDRAIVLIQSMQKNNGELSVKYNLAMSLALIFEELGRYTEAIAVLTEAKTHYESPEYLEIKIRRLQEKAENQPGALGFKR